MQVPGAPVDFPLASWAGRRVEPRDTCKLEILLKCRIF